MADKGSSQSLQELGDDCDFHSVNEALISAGRWRVKVGTGFFLTPHPLPLLEF